MAQYKPEELQVLLLSDYEQLRLFNEETVEKKAAKAGIHDLNNLTGSEWTLHGKSVQIFNGGITEKRKKHGAAFPLSLAKHFIEIYSKEGDTVLDPFAGVGTTLDAANILKRHSLGIELNPDFINLFNKGIDVKDGIQNFDYQRNIFQCSALEIERLLSGNSVDFILTSPPYANLLNKIRDNFADKDYKNNPYKNQSRKLAKPYSVSEEDMGNLSYEDYLSEMKKLFDSLHRIAKQGAYNVWVVRDYRDLDNSLPYINLHGDLTKVATESGWILWDLIIWDQSNQRKLVRLGGNKSRRYYFNIGHSFIVVFRKNMSGEKFK
ncbi:MAG: site-specific DNA-methyltransferase [Dysgonamonadaceae bacterium]|jgi:DNA modification methylase|nr:site-specific DNA-methyltransferase [Dysgonamonadaceae bacterium]